MERRTVVGSSSRREALASRRAARESSTATESTSTPSRTISIHDDDDPNVDRSTSWRQRRVPLQNSLLASLSRALTNIDAQNNGLEMHHRNARPVTTSTSSSSSAMMMTTDNNNHHEEKRYRRIILNPPQSFSSYLNFTRSILRLLMGFTTCYITIFICCLPMLTTTTTTNNNTKSTIGDSELPPGQSFTNIRGRKTYLQVKSKWGTMKQHAIEWERRAQESALDHMNILPNSILESSTVGRRDGVDALKVGRLLEEAVEEFRLEKGREEEENNGVSGNGGKETNGHDHWEEAMKSWEEVPGGQQLPGMGVVTRNKEDTVDSNLQIYKGLHGDKKPGFIVLGMHRSGTSMLSGLLVKGFGYETGGPLIGAAPDNEKGFYERIDIVLQNDEFFSAQRMGWSFNVYYYDPEKALQQKEQGTITFNEGKKGLRFLNNPHKELPYLQKDPRMCITLPTWLKLVDHLPAVVFTYRHPLEVAMSLKKRESGFTFTHGLRLWIVYNMRALQNSAKLCRVFSTNEAVVKNPLGEVQRIADELTKKCNVIAPPVTTMPQSVVDEFVDPKLQHNKEKPGGQEIRAGCVAPIYKSEYEEGSENYKEEKEVFLMAMEIFCDLESGDALKEDYGWPDLETMKWPSSKVH